MNNVLKKPSIVLKKDGNIARLIYISLLIIFCFLPLLFLIINMSKSDLTYVFSDPVFYSSIGNSFIYAISSTAITIVIALFTAYFLSRLKKFKKLFAVLLTIPMLIPTISIGLGIRLLTGTNGFLDKLFHINIDAIGFGGLIIGSVIVAFPPTFLILFDALKYEDKTSYDAAECAGINKFSSFLKITLPYIAKPMLIAGFSCFTLIFSDYGIPMELSGKIKTLPMYLYEQINTSYQYGRGAIVGILLLMPAVISFIFDLIFKDKQSGDAKEQSIKTSFCFNIIGYAFLILVCLLIIIPEISFISLSFMKGYPNKTIFSFENIKNIFVNTHGIGLTRYIRNSLLVAFLTGIFGTIFAYTAAYFSTRLDGKLGYLLHLLSISTVAIPGLVLGVGYIFLFKNTKGFFYGTFAILVVVNIFHFLGSPYLLARNSFNKMNKNYEVVGNSFGISKFKIFINVLIPNSIRTIVEIFSYFFLNSMITISAVSFLCKFSTQPLSILITTFEKTGNYEMQSVVSLLILCINIIFKGFITVFNTIIKKTLDKGGKGMEKELTRFQFDLLTFLEKKGKGKYTQRYLSDTLTVSLGSVNKLIKELTKNNYINIETDGNISISKEGLDALEPYKVKKAIIIAAGFGSRLAPVTLKTPKPLVKVNGVRIIDTLLDSLIEKGIDDITIVRGYKKEQFKVLLKKYPNIRFVENDEFNTSNNISSMMKILNELDRCYICEADLLISNKDIINKYEYTTCFTGAKVKQTDDWCFRKVKGFAKDFKIGGEDCYQAYGISFWNKEDSVKLREDIKKVYNSRGGKETFWDMVPLKICRKHYKIEIKSCHKSDIIEIDNFSELVLLDKSYNKYPGKNEF